MAIHDCVFLEIVQLLIYPKRQSVHRKKENNGKFSVDGRVITSNVKYEKLNQIFNHQVTVFTFHWLALLDLFCHIILKSI